MNGAVGTTDLPALKSLKDLLRDLLGRDVQLALSDRWSPKAHEPVTVAVYIHDRSDLSALICCDLPLSIALAASIALVPARTAAECLEDGQLTNDLGENMYEVLNILASLFNAAGRPHVKLDSVHGPGQIPPSDVVALLGAFGRREDVTITVAGYGGGQMSIVLA
ncbi:MAG: hypothetical protein ACOH1Y_15815 [Propionicimonas sp.]